VVRLCVCKRDRYPLAFATTQPQNNEIYPTRNHASAKRPGGYVEIRFPDQVCLHQVRCLCAALLARAIHTKVEWLSWLEGTTHRIAMMTMAIIRLWLQDRVKIAKVASFLRPLQFVAGLCVTKTPSSILILERQRVLQRRRCKHKQHLRFQNQPCRLQMRTCCRRARPHAHKIWVLCSLTSSHSRKML
jgi:hypothetical protein